MTAPSVPSWLAGARGTLAKATQGPLRVAPDDEWTIVADGLTVAENLRSEGDTAVHVLAVNALPALCAVVEAADEVRDNRTCSCFGRGLPCARCEIAWKALDAALLALASVPRG